MALEKDKPKKKSATSTQRIMATLIDGAILFFLIKLAYTTSNSTLTCILIPFGYYFITEAIWDRTIGKMVFGLMVVDSNKDVYDEGRMILKILIRTISRPIGIIGFVFTFSNQLWHDQISNTHVIQRKTLPEAYYAG
jgi:uncharacterized RDD family membrane protein YckC